MYEAAKGTTLRRDISPGALVFVALVVATVGAFFVTTRLKRSAPVIERLTFNRHFSPNGDRRFDFVTFGLRLRRPDDVTISIVTRDGTRVRTISENLHAEAARRLRFRWDGRTSSGRIAPDGEYHVRVGLRRQGRVVTSGRKIFLDTRPPRPVVGFVKPAVIRPGAGAAGIATLRYSGPRRRPELLVYRTDLGKPRLVARRAARAGADVLQWRGRVGRGATSRRAAPGSYLLVVRARDAAGNIGPADLPPRRGAVRGHPGVTVRYLTATPPVDPPRAGALAGFDVFAAGRRYRWQVRRLGSQRVVSKGVSRSDTLRVRAPRGASGLAVLRLRAGGHRFATPFAYGATGRRRVLVVLPAITWQASNPVESNGDGFPDVLPLDAAVPLRRPFARAGRPPGFAATAAVLRHLREAGLRYDLTTDLTLVRGAGAGLRRHAGVLIAGTERFVPPSLTRALAAYVKGGGKLAWLGTRGFTRSVAVTGSAIARGRPTQFLGERVQIERGPRALVVLGDGINFFAGVNGAFGPFPRVEPQVAPPAGTKALASAGAEPRRPDIVVYRYGRGTVARLGVDGFARALAASPAANRIMGRLWALLSR